MLNIIISWCQKFWNQILDIGRWVLESTYDLFEGLFYFILDSLFFVIETIFTAIDFAQFSALNTLQAWSGLPPQIIWLLNYLNIPVCLSFIVLAYGIRLLANLIPTWATRA